MKILDLPLEILHIILFYAALSRGVKRALRLRLVCKTIEGAMYPALFETHMMDYVHTTPIGSDPWQSRHQHGADKLWHRYIVYRIMDPKSMIGRFSEIRQIAQVIHQEAKTGLGLQATVEALCWLALTHATQFTRNKGKWWYPNMRESKQRTVVSLNTLLSAAAYFDLMPLAKRLVAEGHSPTSHNYLFAPPIQVAAQAGNTTMLQLFQEHLPDPSFEPLALIGAAIRGDLKIAKLALQGSVKMGQGEDIRDRDSIDGQSFGSVKHTSTTGKAILDARNYTSNPEVHEYLTSALTPWPDQLASAHINLLRHAELGNISMVRYLIDLGVPLQHPLYLVSPLVMACRGWHNDIAALLLDRGAYPIRPPGPTERTPALALYQSATAGNLSLVRKLCDHGVTFNDAPSSLTLTLPVLFWPFAQEHTGMIQLLLERGASFDERWKLVGQEKGCVGRFLMEVTTYLGYDSMTEILRQHGFEMIETPKYTGRHPPMWCRWDQNKATDSEL